MLPVHIHCTWGDMHIPSSVMALPHEYWWGLPPLHYTPLFLGANIYGVDLSGLLNHHNCLRLCAGILGYGRVSHDRQETAGFMDFFLVCILFNSPLQSTRSFSETSNLCCRDCILCSTGSSADLLKIPSTLVCKFSSNWQTESSFNPGLGAGGEGVSSTTSGS